MDHSRLHQTWDIDRFAGRRGTVDLEHLDETRPHEQKSVDATARDLFGRVVAIEHLTLDAFHRQRDGAPHALQLSARLMGELRSRGLGESHASVLIDPLLDAKRSPSDRQVAELAELVQTAVPHYAIRRSSSDRFGPHEVALGRSLLTVHDIMVNPASDRPGVIVWQVVRQPSALTPEAPRLVREHSRKLQDFDAEVRVLLVKLFDVLVADPEAELRELRVIVDSLNLNANIEVWCEADDFVLLHPTAALPPAHPSR